jgi:FKBP-type peptidyl-prolyl cis-trans isomerase SlyD
MEAAHGAVVSLNYTLKNDEGELLDGTDTPIQYLHGYDNIIPGLEKALEGAEPGQQRSVVLEPTEAYGAPDPAKILTLPPETVPDDVEMEPGMMVVGETPNGPVNLTVREVNEDGIVVDANHPLAGETLHFEVEVVDVRAASEEEKTEGCVRPQ